MSATLELANGLATCRFNGSFGLEEYQLFLKAKLLPERALDFDRMTGEYTIVTHERFAHILGAALPERAEVKWTIAPHLFDYQAELVRHAIQARRFAFYWDCGMGKTPAELEWCRIVQIITGGKVLILCPLAVVGQTLRECSRFYDGKLEVLRLNTLQDLMAWLTDGAPGIAICNTEKMAAGIIPEFRNLSGIALDESSILKGGGGVTKWNLIKSCRGITYKLSLTATPAPNDTMEFASQAGWLEKLRDESEILWTFFVRDDQGEWRVKPHSREAFYRFMAGWSVFLRDPRNYGFTDNLKAVPAPEFFDHKVEATPEQMAIVGDVLAATHQGLLVEEAKLGVTARLRLSQAAKGFVYSKSEPPKAVPSLKPAEVARIVKEEYLAGRPVIVWTIFDEESRILTDLLTEMGVPCASISGETKVSQREEIVAEFQAGKVPCLITKASLLGFGVNLQTCAAMVFSGFDDSYERYYQAVRRAYRYGQERKVRVHTVWVPELEGMILDNTNAKRVRFEADATEMERCYAKALREVLN
ncbi:hypothetical protein EON81_07915 [bacterium]|nr:MAG: hypothetical protein EON81_07915 [bacterium]